MANYQAIIDAIDQAVLSGVSAPGQIRAADGRLITYRSLDELMRLRQYYTRLAAATRGAIWKKIHPGSARGGV